MNEYKSSLDDNEKFVDDDDHINFNLQFGLDKTHYKINSACRGEGISIADEAESLKLALSKQSSPAVLSILVDLPVLQSLNNFYRTFNSLINEFGYRFCLSNLPYPEFCFIITHSKDPKEIVAALKCLAKSIQFDSSWDLSKITNEVINFLEKNMFEETFSLESIQLIRFLCKSSPELSERFCSNGFLDVIKTHLTKKVTTKAIIDLIGSCSMEYSVKFLFLLLELMSMIEDELLLLDCFQGISVFVIKYSFDAIPEHFMHPTQNCDVNTVQFIYSQIAEKINSVNFDFVLEILRFCLLLPQKSPPNILPLLLQYIKDDTLVQVKNFIPTVSQVLCYFSETWKPEIPRQYFVDLYNFISEKGLNYEIDLVQFKFILMYHQICYDDFDLRVVELCTRYICCPDRGFSSICVSMFLDVIDKFQKSPQGEIQKNCLEILYNARENLWEQISDPDVSNDDKAKLQTILNLLTGFMKISIESAGDVNDETF